jgi:hypothetical protein
MNCLFATDYGPADPAFDPFVENGRLLEGFESHRQELATARNFAELRAMERQLGRGQEVAWCAQGYGWAYQPAVGDFITAAMVAVVLPCIVFRLLPRRRGARRGRAAVATAARLDPAPEIS